MTLDKAREVLDVDCKESNCDECPIARMRKLDSVIYCMDVMREAGIRMQNALDGVEDDGK